VLQSKEMAPQTILFEATSIAVLALSVYALHRAGIRFERPPATKELERDD
jgi:hypothetical protein